MKNIICKICYKKHKVLINRKTALYCSRNCYYKARRRGLYLNNVPLLCNICKSEYLVNMARLKKSLYCSRLCANRAIGLNHTGQKHPNWGGGIKIDKDGYVLIRKTKHPFAVQGYIREHRLIMERIIGRYLLKDEIVHHKNENKADNHVSNLELMKKTEHDRIHTIKRWRSGDLFGRTKKVELLT